MLQTHLKKFALLVAGALALTACTTAGTKVDREGMAEELVWPKPEGTTFNKNRGTFPDLSSLKEIRNGMTKDQLYYLIGRPQYSEGFRVREWDYLFHFNTPGQGTDGVTTCQYKILFDNNKFARSFHWNPVDPIDAVCPPPEQVTPAPVPVPPLEPNKHRFTLSADALFKFDKSDVANMLPQGRAELDQLANHLRNNFRSIQSINIMGHTDFKGSDEYNLGLSMRRALTVRTYLAERGIPANIMFPYGLGESQPVKQCVDRGRRQELIDCLQPNRRVELEVNGESISQGNSMTIQPVAPVQQ